MALLRLAFAAWLLSIASAAAAAPSEYQVKAVFLFNFSQFVEWPPQALGSADAPFVICLVGKDNFGADLDAAVKTETVQGRPLVIKRSADAAHPPAPCHMLFIDNSAGAHLGGILTDLNGRPVLTVSDIGRSAEQGAIIEFVSDRNRLRLRINVAAAKAAGLTISSKLLRPAEIVGDTPG